jgi:hypothetical protein
MVRVAQRGRFAVYVYSEKGQRHHEPHCHVVWSDGAASVSLLSRERLIGDPLPRGARRLVDDSLAALKAEWNRLNPGRPVE